MLTKRINFLDAIFLNGQHISLWEFFNECTYKVLKKACDRYGPALIVFIVKMGSNTQMFMFKNKQRGQGMTEYIIIVALIAVAAIAVYQFFGQTIRNQTAGIANEVAGQSGGAAITAAQTAATAASGEGVKKGLNKYTNDNSR